MSKSQAGLTLIEVLISLVIVLLISTLAMQVIPISKINRDANVDQTLTLRVKAYMEDLAFNMQGKAFFEAPTVSNFTSGIYTCTPAVSDPDNVVAPGTAQRKRVVLTCSASGKTNIIFATEYGRPE